MDLGIYIHIPFCLHKCPYCNFNSLAVNHLPESKYVKALTEEIKDRAIEFKSYVVETIYFGGGTPSLFSLFSIDKILANLASSFKLHPNCEITLEVNPKTVDFKKLSDFHAIGINRLSLGIQSFKNNLLKILRRIHSAQEALISFEQARKAGFENIGIDLMFGIPSQTISDWKTDLKQVLTLYPEHISTYQLHLEEGTQFYKRMLKGELNLTAEDVLAEMYEITREILIPRGYEQYEISNFALNKFYSRHNLRYWNGKDYLGIGAGAHSFIKDNWGIRWVNISNPFQYIKSAQKIESKEILTKKEAMEEAIFLGLRQTKGINLKRFEKRFGLKLLLPHYLEGLLTVDRGFLKLTPLGFLLSNEVFLRLMP